MSSYEELLTPILKTNDPQKGEVEFDGMNMEAICVLLNFLDKRLDKVDTLCLFYEWIQII